MSNISWNEVEHRASEFASKWQGEVYEKGESQSFWSDFLTIFGVDRKMHGVYFEYAVKKLDNSQGYIDMLWPGKLLAEQKSAGKDLSKASMQAFEYLHNLAEADRPQYIVVSDFTNFELMNLDTLERTSFSLEQFPKKVKLFGFLIGRESQNPQEEDPVNRKAAETMARLHNQLRDSNYTGHDLELLLVRLMFCLFADDAAIFERGSFEQYLRSRTNADGSDLGSKLVEVFQTLATDHVNRQSIIDQDLDVFPYVNGGLFEEPIRTPSFTSDMRRELIAACDLDWSQVSPAIFGSMFQGVMDEKARRNLGAHYTSERNIMKVIKPLFLDDLNEEFDKAKRSKKKLLEFHDKLARLKFLDPACGCGNFLVVTYRELRKLEHRVLEAIHGRQALLTDVTDSIKVNVDQMYGIEIEEFPSLIAETALWLTDHQMNMAASMQFGHHFVRLPLSKKANITNDNALTVDWEEVIAPTELNYILGNPPFNGSKFMIEQQREHLVTIFGGLRGAGILDFVSAWYAKAAKYTSKNPVIETALVSTNSITQGEQVGVLWKYMLDQGVHINFAHRTFKWTNEGKGVAAVYCVIIGFSYVNRKDKRLYTYADIKAEPEVSNAKNINPYLVDAVNVVVTSRQKPLSLDVPGIGIGNKPVDGGNYLFTNDEKQDFLLQEPQAEKYFHKWLGSDEFINGTNRWVLWLGDADPSELRSMPLALERIERVRQFRLASRSEGTRKLAATPTRFHVENIPASDYLVIPKVSSERRKYIPIGYETADTFVSDLVFILKDASPYHFAVLTGSMHMSWMIAVCGRLKSDFRYSKDIVYNNFPWPQNTTESQKLKIAELGQAVLDVRNQFPGSSLADLYDPRTMPASLAQCHARLDRAVEKLYDSKLDLSVHEVRLKLLFDLFEKQTKAI